ncbi:MAG: hypothetical protein KC416_15890 [Myxococcales bacterium]|nr:hypothetical protein [Myxococcales bacterium]
MNSLRTWQPERQDSDTGYMPRTRLASTPGFPHHLISRFAGRSHRMRGPKERARYLLTAQEIPAPPSLRRLAYALMGTHTHWAAQSTEDNVSGFLHPLHTGFARWWNRKHGGLGPVFADRPKQILVGDPEHLALLIAYIHNNPVRAGVVKGPSDSDWTSHRAYLGESTAPPWLDVDWTLAEMGFSSAPSGRLAFHDFVVSRSPYPRDPSLAGPGPVGPTFGPELVNAVAQAYELPTEDLVLPKVPSRTTKRAQRALVHISSEVFGVSSRRLATDLGMSPSWAYSIAKRQQRETPSRQEVEQVVTTFLENGRLDRDVPARPLESI